VTLSQPVPDLCILTQQNDRIPPCPYQGGEGEGREVRGVEGEYIILLRVNGVKLLHLLPYAAAVSLKAVG